MSTEEVKALVEELRYGAEYGCDADLIERAADAIEELVADLGDADAMTEMWMKKYEALQAEVKRLEQERDELIGQMPELTETADGWKWKWKPHWVSVEELPKEEGRYWCAKKFAGHWIFFAAWYWNNVSDYIGVPVGEEEKAGFVFDEDVVYPDYWMPIEPPQEDA